MKPDPEEIYVLSSAENSVIDVESTRNTPDPELCNMYANLILPEDFNYGATDIEATLALNEVESCLINDYVEKLEEMKTKNKEKQITLNLQHMMWHERRRTERFKAGVSMYLPPYFKDEFNMTAPLNAEAKHKKEFCNFNPLDKKEKDWTKVEINVLKNAVRDAMCEIICSPLQQKLEILSDKINSAGKETSQHQITQWKQEYSELSKQITYERNHATLDELYIRTDPNDIDWSKISVIDFKCRRPPISCQLKWLNEVCPRWSKDKWTNEEDRTLKAIAESEQFISWDATATELGTGRTPWQCFERYKSKLQVIKREWTSEEDEKLMTLCNILKTEDGVYWPKVVFFMPGRSQPECRIRYESTLNASLKRGRWSAEEDLLLITAVKQIGGGNWKRIAKCVPHRSSYQCRERWATVVETEKNMLRTWTIEEDEKLILLIQIIGRGHWSKCIHFFENRSGDSIRNRFKYILKSKIKMAYNYVRMNPNAKRGNRKAIGITAEHYEKMLFQSIKEHFTDTEFNKAKLKAFIGNIIAENGHLNKRPNLTEEEILVISKNISEVANIYRVNDKIDMKILFELVEVSEKDIEDFYRKIYRDRIYYMNKVASKENVTPNKTKIINYKAEISSEEDEPLSKKKKICPKKNKPIKKEIKPIKKDNKTSKQQKCTPTRIQPSRKMKKI